MKRRPPKTISEHAYLNLRHQGAGPIRAMKGAAEVCTTVAALAMAAHELGHWPSQAEYADYWNVTGRTAQREWARFREVFPGEGTPDRLAKHVATELGKRVENLALANSVVYPEQLVAA